MAQPKKQDINTGNGGGSRPILASEKQSTADELKPSPTHTNIAEGSTKPVSLTEALSLLQTLCLDLQSLECRTAILAHKNGLVIAISPPASIGKIGFSNGHITANGLPVSDL